ncbi:MAG: LptF/LptG family permease [Planctomycetota bacterium]
MPWTLWRYATVELWRLVLISTLVLVLVIAFSAAVKPLADGTLGPAQALAFMVLATVPMLAYALPFAAAFGTALAYHRMAQDNEVVAALAGGLPHRTLIVPAIASGIVLAGALGLLNEQIIPRFLQRMEQMITLDAVDVLVRRLDRGESAALGSLVVHAGSIREIEGPPEGEITKALHLRDVTAIEVTDEGEVLDDATAEHAWVSLWPGDTVGIDDGSLVGYMRFQKASMSNEGTLGTAGEFTTPLFRVPNAFEDDPKFLTAGELQELRDHPERMSFIRSRQSNLAREMARLEIGEELRSTLAAGKPVRFTGPDGVFSISSARARGFGDWTLVPRGAETISIEIDRADTLGTDIITAAGGELIIEEAAPTKDVTVAASAEQLTQLSLSLVLRDLVIGSDGSPVTTGRAERRYTGLVLASDPLPELSGLTALGLLDRANAKIGSGDLATGRLAERRDALSERIAKLGREITSKQHERLAMAAACLVMVLSGAVTALKLRHAMPLVVYLWTFFPALGVVLLISIGQESVHDSGAIGIPILWSGVAGLGVAATLGVLRIKRTA